MPQFATLTATDLADQLDVVAFRGTETLCRPYEFHIHLAVKGDTAVDMERAIGSRATLTMQRQREAPFAFHGLLAEVRLTVQTPEWAIYEALLVPKIAQLALTRMSRVFTKQSVPEIIETVLEDGGLSGGDYELRLEGSYDPEELVVQYKESALDFLHRWLEHEGLYYFFEQGEAQEKLVIVDHRSSHAKLVDKPVRYFPLAGHDHSAGECFDAFTVIRSRLPSRVRVADYDYARPMLDVSSTADVSARGVGVVSSHAGRFFDPEQAKRFARLRAEELKAGEVTVHAAGAALHVGAGHLVELSEHPNDGFNTEYLVTEAHHFCNQTAHAGLDSFRRYLKPEHDEVYRVEIQALDAATQYRPPRATTWPRVWGYEAGVVDGEADSDYAQLDEQGRYLVKFHFDESDLKEGKASTWVRMVQPHGGTVEGFHFPLRKGTEVIFNFLGGDPDRPVIAGVVPNTATPSAVTRDNRTENVIRTGSNNYIKLQDKKGNEYIHFYTPKETEVFMGGPSAQYFPEGSRQRSVSVPPTGDQPVQNVSKDIEAALYVYTDKSASYQVLGDWWQDVGGSLNVNVGADATIFYQGAHNLRIDGHSSEFYNAGLDVKVTGNENRQVTATLDVKADGEAKLTTPTWTNSVSGLTEISTGAMKHRSGETQLTYGNTSIDWSSTSGSMRSLELSVPGGVKISSSSVTITTPSHKVTDPLATWYGSSYTSTYAKRLDVTGSSMGFTALGVSISGLKVANAGISVVKLGSAIFTKGVKKETAAVEAKDGGIMSVLKGFITFT